MSITILRPKNYQSKVYQNIDGESTYYYISVLLQHGEINVKVDQAIIDKWDSIITMDIAIERLSKTRSSVDRNKMVDLNWSRYTIVNYTTIDREIKLLEHEIMLKRIESSVANEINDLPGFFQLMESKLKILKLISLRDSESAMVLGEDE